MPSSLERRLSEAEIDYVDKVTFFAAHIIVYKGELDIEAMRVAYRALADRYPVLRARIEDRPGEMVLCAPEGHYPTFVAAQGDWETLLREAEAFNEVRKGDVSSLHIIYNGASGYVLLGYDHLAVAAGAAWTFLSRLWQLCTDAVNGVKVDNRSGNKLPEPGDKFTPVAPSKALGDGVSNRDSLYLEKAESSQFGLKINQDGAAQKRQQGAGFLAIDTDHFQRIREACRAHKAGLGTYIGAVMATVLRDRSPMQGKLPMNFVIAIDHAADRANFTDVTVSHVRHRIQVNVDLGCDPFSVSSELEKKIKQARSERILFDDFATGDQDINLNGYGKLTLNHPHNLDIDFDIARVISYGNLKPSQPLAKNDVASKVLQHKPSVSVSSITYNNQLRVKASCSPSLIDDPQCGSLCDDFIRRLKATA